MKPIEKILRRLVLAAFVGASLFLPTKNGTLLFSFRAASWPKLNVENAPALWLRSSAARAPRTSLDSGIIVSEDGYILSSYHVVSGADEIKVALGDERIILDARIVGTDPDVATRQCRMAFAKSWG